MEIKLENNTLKLSIPLSSGTSSKSGKTLLLASTNGFVTVAGTDLRVSVNVIKPK